MDSPPQISDSDQSTSISNTSELTPSYSQRQTFVDALLAEGSLSVGKLNSCPNGNSQLADLIKQLQEILRIMRAPNGPSIDDQYRLVFPFAQWLNRYPFAIEAISNKDTIFLVSLAHFFAVLIVLEFAFPAIDIALLSSIRKKCIVEIDRIVQLQPTVHHCCTEPHHISELMLFPMRAVHIEAFIQKP
jgi:hypothetical protein